MPHRRTGSPTSGSPPPALPHDLEVPLPFDERELAADAAMTQTDQHAAGYGRRASDASLGAVVQKAQTIENKVTTIRNLGAAGIGAVVVVVAVLGWLGWKNQSPREQIDDLRQIVRENAAAGASRDSAMQSQVSELRLSVRELGYTVCLGSSEGRAPDGPARCAQRFLIVRESRQ